MSGEVNVAIDAKINTAIKGQVSIRTLLPLFWNVGVKHHIAKMRKLPSHVQAALVKSNVSKNPLAKTTVTPVTIKKKHCSLKWLCFVID